MDEFGNEPVVPFVLLPSFGYWTREGRMNVNHKKSIGDEFIAIFPVLVSFENSVSRRSFPSLDKLAKLAGVSPNTAQQQVLTMSIRPDRPNGWLHIIKKPIGHGRTQHIYQMAYAAYAGTESKEWIRIARAVFHKGVWAVMTPSARRVYLVLRAHGQFMERADGEWVEIEDTAGVLATEVYVPAAYWATSHLVKATGLNERTVREAKAWFIAADMAYPTADDQEEGVMMPFDPQRHAPKVLESIAATRKRNTERGIAPAASGYAKRDIQRLRRTQAAGQKKSTSTQSVRVDAAVKA